MMSDADIVVPKLNIDILKLQNKDGFSNIAVFRSELYTLPTTSTEEFFEVFSVGKYSETSINEVTDDVVEKPGTLLIDPFADNSTEKNGCSSSVSIVSVGLTTAIAAGYAICKKKREE